MTAAMAAMWKTMNKSSAERHKTADKRIVKLEDKFTDVDEKLRECVFAKGKLEGQFESDRKAHATIIQSMIEENYWNKKRKRDRRTGG